MKRNIQRMLVKACCLSGILVGLNIDMLSWKGWLFLFSLAIALELDILFFGVDKEKPNEQQSKDK